MLRIGIIPMRQNSDPGDKLFSGLDWAAIIIQWIVNCTYLGLFSLISAARSCDDGGVCNWVFPIFMIFSLSIGLIIVHQFALGRYISQIVDRRPFYIRKEIGNMYFIMHIIFGALFILLAFMFFFEAISRVSGASIPLTAFTILSIQIFVYYYFLSAYQNYNAEFCPSYTYWASPIRRGVQLMIVISVSIALVANSTLY